MTAISKACERRPIGATSTSEGFLFRVWAPERKSVHLVFLSPDGRETRKVNLAKDADGYFSTCLPDVVAGELYSYQLDQDPKLYPDPGSQFQPLGLHGPSQVIDHSRFPWTDNDWRGCELPGQVLYELHIGTFTPEGTWTAAQEKLPLLLDIGVTTIEVMPVAAFFGKFGWGYDGVFWYAPTELYGEPDDFRRFVNEAHNLGLGVILDVVYNHFGPVGNYTAKFSPYYLSDKHNTDWGTAINFDGQQCGPVREFVAQNAAYWIQHFHLDGLRLDATQAIIDDSETHIVTQLTQAARAAAGNRSILVFSEDERNRPFQVMSPDKGGFGIDGLWNDDFHHTCRVALTGNREAYYKDYSGSPQELLSAVRRGYLYQGQWNSRQRMYRGCASRYLAAPHFVHFLQNHDQIANSVRPVRTHLLTSPGRQRALTALLLLGPQTPMLFMGQEFAASAPFFYFADHEPELAELVRKGRIGFMSQFESLVSFRDGRELPDPSDAKTFANSKLDWSERDRNQQFVQLHQDLIRMRRNDPVFSRQDNSEIEGAVIGPEALILRWYDATEKDRLLLLNLGRAFAWYPIAEPTAAPPPHREWHIMWTSENPIYGGLGTPPINDQQWHIPATCALVLEAKEATDFTGRERCK